MAIFSACSFSRKSPKITAKTLCNGVVQAFLKNYKVLNEGGIIVRKIHYSGPVMLYLFILLIFMGNPLIILIGCMMVFLSSFSVVIKMVDF